MNWLEFISSLIHSLAWPATVVALVIILRRPIAKLVPFLERLKFRDLELAFGTKLRQVAEEAQAALPPALEPPSDFDRERLEAMADISPRGAVLEAWLEVERAAVEALHHRQVDLSHEDKRSPTRLRRALISAGIIGRPQASLYNDLRGLRNSAAHLPDFDLDFNAAHDYVDMALKLANTIRSAAQAMAT